MFDTQVEHVSVSRVHAQMRDGTSSFSIGKKQRYNYATHGENNVSEETM